MTLDEQHPGPVPTAARAPASGSESGSVSLPVDLPEARNGSAAQRDTRAGYEIYRNADGAVPLDDLNVQLIDDGYRPVSLRAYNHFRKLLHAGYTRYVSINRLDVARASAPYENASGNGRYSYRPCELDATVLFAKASTMHEAPGRTIAVGDVGALVGFDRPEAVAGLRSLKPRPGDTVSIHLPGTGATVGGRVVEADIQPTAAAVEVEFARLTSLADIGAAVALPTAELVLTVECSDAAGTLDGMNRQLYHLLELLEGVRALANRAAESLPDQPYASPPGLNRMSAAPHPSAVIRVAPQVTRLLPGDNLGAVLAAAAAVPSRRSRWHDTPGDTPSSRLVAMQTEHTQLHHELRAREAELTDEILLRVERTFMGSAMGRGGARTLVNVHVLPPLRALGGLGVTRVSVSSNPR